MRVQSYKKSLLTSYGVIVAQFLNAIFIIRLALSYMDEEVFGIWMLMTQMGLFFQLVDMGFSEAFARILIDYKEKATEVYDRVLKTAFTIFCLQAVVVLMAGYILTFFLPSVLKIPEKYQSIFSILLLCQFGVMAFSCVVRIFNQVLFAEQKIYLSNFAIICALFTSFVMTFSALQMGWGIWSLLIGGVALVVVQCLICAYFALSGGLLKFSFLKARFNLAMFKEIFSYGFDRFWATLGDRTLKLLPIFIVTPFLGLAGAATWGLVSRGLALCEGIVSKPLDMAYPAFAQMHVREEKERFYKRYDQVVRICCAATAIIAVGIAAFLDPVIRLWSGGKIEIPSSLGFLVAFYFAAVTFKRSLWPCVTIPKKMGYSRFTNLVDAGLFIGVSVLILGFAPSLSWMVLILSFCMIGTSCLYMFLRMRTFPLPQNATEIFKRYQLLILALAIGALSFPAIALFGKDLFFGRLAWTCLSLLLFMLIAGRTERKTLEALLIPIKQKLLSKS